MKTSKIKNLYRSVGFIAGLATSLAIGGYIGDHSGYKRGHERGRETVKQEVRAAGDILIRNCEHYMDVLKSGMYGPPEEQQRLLRIYERELSKRNDVRSLVNDVSNDNIAIGIENSVK